MRSGTFGLFAEAERQKQEALFPCDMREIRTPERIVQLDHTVMVESPSLQVEPDKHFLRVPGQQIQAQRRIQPGLLHILGGGKADSFADRGVLRDCLFQLAHPYAPNPKK